MPVLPAQETAIADFGQLAKTGNREHERKTLPDGQDAPDAREGINADMPVAIGQVSNVKPAKQFLAGLSGGQFRIGQRLDINPAHRRVTVDPPIVANLKTTDRTAAVKEDIYGRHQGR